jgi:hypothetical protein
VHHFIARPVLQFPNQTLHSHEPDKTNYHHKKRYIFFSKRLHNKKKKRQQVSFTQGPCIKFMGHKSVTHDPSWLLCPKTQIAEVLNLEKIPDANPRTCVVNSYQICNEKLKVSAKKWLEFPFNLLSLCDYLYPVEIRVHYTTQVHMQRCTLSTWFSCMGES